MEIKAPNDYGSMPKPWIFLAGSIEIGTAKNWQEKVAAALPDVTILNPRRDDWDSSWVQSINNLQFREQVEWELKAMEDADFILFHFEPGTRSPITLLELGLFRGKAIVHCPEGFWHKGNVDIVCKRYDIEQADDLDTLVKRCISKCNSRRIVIKCSPDADTRTATHKVSRDELLGQSFQHIQDVRWAMRWMARILVSTSEKHDWTKLDHIDEFYTDYQAMQSGFQGDFKQMHWYKDLHLQERHHLKDRCPEDVNLFDVLERIADSVMAGLARSGEIYDDSLDPEILLKAYKNTQALLKASTIVLND